MEALRRLFGTKRSTGNMRVQNLPQMSAPLQVVPPRRIGYGVELNAFCLKEEVLRLRACKTPEEDRVCLMRILMQLKIVELSVDELIREYRYGRCDRGCDGDGATRVRRREDHISLAENRMNDLGKILHKVGHAQFCHDLYFEIVDLCYC